jgi:hypothetical protein
MASFNTTAYGQQIGAGASPIYPKASTANGKLRYAAIPYTLAGTEATNDTINLIRLKAGAIPLPSLSKIVCEDPGTALTLDIGFASNLDSLCDGAALTTAHDDFFTKLPSVTAVAAQYVPAAIAAGDEILVATIVLATVPTAGAKLLFLIAYIDE